MNWDPLLLSFQVSVLATLLAALVGLATAAAIARRKSGFFEWIEVAITAPMVLPPTVLGYYLLLILGREGFIGDIFERVFDTPLVFTKGAAVLAGVIAALPFIVKSSRAAFEDVDSRILAAAATLGASPWRVFFTMTLPLSRNGILAGVSLGFARALGDFGVTLMIAGDIPGLTQTGALAIYDAVSAGEQMQAAGLAATLSAFAVAALTLGTKLVRRRNHGW
jgi:molybdate transport system permease protein